MSSPAASTTTSQPTPTGVGQSLLDSLFTPGLNNPTHKLMNNSFYALFVVLLFLIVITRANIHVVFLTCVAIALFITINWFIAELNKMPQSVREPQSMPQGVDDRKRD